MSRAKYFNIENNNNNKKIKKLDNDLFFKNDNSFLAIFDSDIIINDIPSEIEAEKVLVKDINDYYEGDNVEDVLQEIGEKINNSVNNINFEEDHLKYILNSGEKIDAGKVPKENIQIIDGGGAID